MQVLLAVILATVMVLSLQTANTYRQQAVRNTVVIKETTPGIHKDSLSTISTLEQLFVEAAQNQYDYEKLKQVKKKMLKHLLHF